jgi:hypothetical protein
MNASSGAAGGATTLHWLCWCGLPIAGYPAPVLGGHTERRNQLMALILVVLLLALLLGGLGFAIHILWWIALIVLVIWLLGFLVRMGEGSSRGRWYRWLPSHCP